MKTDPVLPRKRMDRGDLFWLVYLIFFFIEALQRGSLRFWMESIALVAVFVALYVAFLRAHTARIRLVLLSAMVVMGIAAYPFNGGAISFFIYVAALIPFVIPSPAIVLTCIVTESVLLAAEGLLLHASPYSYGMGIFFSLVVGGSNIFFAQKQRADCKLRMAHEEIEALAAVAERERIARDLHDVLGHTLSVIVLKAELAGRLLERGQDVQRAAAEIADVERTARNALADVRETIGGYRARGLAAEMKAAREALPAAGVTLEMEGSPVPRSLRPGEETVLALALREAVTNIVRHAQAKTCRLSFAVEHGRHTLTIADDGRHSEAREGNGLRGMRERVESIGGRLQLEREHGTRLLIELPVTGSTS